MIVKFEKRELKLEEIHKEEISKENFVSHELVVLDLIRRWLTNQPSFAFETSGSTGAPKTLEVSREKIVYSSQATLARLDPNKTFKSSLLCLNPRMIGGAMVVFRALLHNLDLRVISPTSDPFLALGPTEVYDLVSMVPLQVQHASPEQLSHFSAILVGGAALSRTEPKSKAKIYSTFGMTETVSHFALREVNEAAFLCTGDAIVDKSESGTLKIKGTITDHKWLVSNDLIDLISSTAFKWLGRSDFIINSGGVKVNPEQIEQVLSKQVPTNFIVTSIPDEKLGRKVILLLEGDFEDVQVDFSTLEKYQRPKEIHYMKAFDFTSSGKIDRLRTGKKFLSGLKHL